MADKPEFAGFAPLEIDDRTVVAPFLRRAGVSTSELTFTNLFMWRHRYHPLWCLREGSLTVILRPDGEAPFALPPVGGDGLAALGHVFAVMDQAGVEPLVARADQGFVDAWTDPERHLVERSRDQDDYVYLSEELIKLPGRRFHRKKNHFNKFVKNVAHQYQRLDGDLVGAALDLQNAWCELRDCSDNEGLLNEDRAIYEAFCQFGVLDYVGGAIVIDGTVEAFSIGELLSEDTAVIHIEKANPEIPGLYAAINQRFVADAWADVAYVNREQDLGIDGLRQAKESYNPHHMVEKHTIRPR